MESAEMRGVAMSRRKYVAPEAKVFSLCVEERIAAVCYDGQILTLNYDGCNTSLKDGGGGTDCFVQTMVQGS